MSSCLGDVEEMATYRKHHYVPRFYLSVCQKTSQLSESKGYVPIFEWRRFIIFGRIKVILTIYRLI